MNALRVESLKAANLQARRLASTGSELQPALSLAAPALVRLPSEAQK